MQKIQISETLTGTVIHVPAWLVVLTVIFFAMIPIIALGANICMRQRLRQSSDQKDPT